MTAPLLNPSNPLASSRRDGARHSVWLAGGLLVFAGLLAYWNSFAGAFVFDDLPAIRDNPSIRDWTAVGQIFSPPSLLTTSGRPVLNASLAISYALSGNHTWGYHAFNLAVHLMAGLFLFGVVRRTLALPRFHTRFGADALPLSLLVAALWMLHPLQTEAVTYVIQRAESLMGLFFLATLYCFIRGGDSPNPRRWQVGAIAACALGMGTKEVMVSAPLIALLYDRAFLTGSFRAAWATRKKLYLGLAATWLILGMLVASEGGNRGGSIGFGVEVGWWRHALTQFPALARYLALTVWPSSLVFEYEPEWIAHAIEVAPQALLVAGLAALTGVGLWRASAIGVAGAWAFGVLAPTSLMPAPTQLIAEHRMYLPLAPLLVIIVLGTYRWLGHRSLVAFAAAAVACAFLTAQRNVVYRSEVSLWADTAAKRPLNPRAQASLGNALSNAGRLTEALPHCLEAVRLDPTNALLHYSLGLLLAKMERPAEALSAYTEAIRLRPGYADAHTNLGVLFARAGRRDEALREFGYALLAAPTDAAAHYNTGALLTEMGRPTEAIGHFSAALQQRPDYPEACVGWGMALAFQGDVEGALQKFAQALALRPGDLLAHNKAGLLLLAVNRIPEAVTHFEAALDTAPADAATRKNLKDALQRLEGIAQ